METRCRVGMIQMDTNLQQKNWRELWVQWRRARSRIATGLPLPKRKGEGAVWKCPHNGCTGPSTSQEHKILCAAKERFTGQKKTALKDVTVHQRQRGNYAPPQGPVLAAPTRHRPISSPPRRPPNVALLQRASTEPPGLASGRTHLSSVV